MFKRIDSIFGADSHGNKNSWFVQGLIIPFLGPKFVSINTEDSIQIIGQRL